jgi:hypothetical protein
MSHFHKKINNNAWGMVGISAAALISTGCSLQNNEGHQQDQLSVSSVEAATYSQNFFRNPPMLQADGTEQPAAENSAKLTWSTIPSAVEVIEPVSFKLPSGETHWYQTVYLPEGGVNWVQAQELAEQKGGYLVSLHSQEENDFAYSLVTDTKFWRKFPYGELDDGTPIFNLSGPYLGGYQVDGAEEPGGGWEWVSGEPMTWTNWLQEGLDIGVNIPPDNQPNNSARGAQNVLAFGEVDHVASYWCDVSHLMGTYGSGRLPSHGFIIEYETKPLTR